MKKNKEEIEEMLPEYNFSGGVRGKYAGRLAEANGYIKIDPQVSKYFKKPEDINNILIAIVNSFPKKTLTAK